MTGLSSVILPLIWTRLTRQLPGLAQPSTVDLLGLSACWSTVLKVLSWGQYPRYCWLQKRLPILLILKNILKNILSGLYHYGSFYVVVSRLLSDLEMSQMVRITISYVCNFFSNFYKCFLFGVLLVTFLSLLYINHMNQFSSNEVHKIVQFGIPSYNSTNLDGWQGIVLLYTIRRN